MTQAQRRAALTFALGSGSGRALVLFGVCVALLVALVFLQRAAVRLLTRGRG